jgi:hypothetical protein
MTVLALARRECESRLDAGQSLDEVESYIDSLPMTSDGRAALWLWAWSWCERARRRSRRPLTA